MRGRLPAVEEVHPQGEDLEKGDTAWAHDVGNLVAPKLVQYLLTSGGPAHGPDFSGPGEAERVEPALAGARREAAGGPHRLQRGACVLIRQPWLHLKRISSGRLAHFPGEFVYYGGQVTHTHT